MEKFNTDKCSACPYGPPDWRYKCRECGHEFEMPAPTGPSDEKSRACLKCKSKSIDRVDIVKSEACPPGG